MAEIYDINVDGDRLRFTPSQQSMPEYIYSASFDPNQAHAGVGVVTRMGATDLTHCVVFREQGKPGGIFALHDGEGFLFAAIARSNLAYTLARGFFGQLTASCAAGVEIFDHMADSDD